MKLQIRYEPNADETFGCCARTEYQGKDYFGIGKTWEAAKENLMKKINAILGAKVPSPETVEVKVADEEMDTELLPWVDQIDTKLAEIGVTSRDIEPGKV